MQKKMSDILAIFLSILWIGAVNGNTNLKHHHIWSHGMQEPMRFDAFDSIDFY